MSKYGVEGLTNTLRYELAKFGVQVTSIEPGAVKTHMTADPVNSTARIWDRSSPAIRERYEAKLRPITDAPREDAAHGQRAGRGDRGGAQAGRTCRGSSRATWSARK